LIFCVVSYSQCNVLTGHHCVLEIIWSVISWYLSHHLSFQKNMGVINLCSHCCCLCKRASSFHSSDFTLFYTEKTHSASLYCFELFWINHHSLWLVLAKRFSLTVWTVNSYIPLGWWSWSQGSWIYDYLFKQWLSALKLWVLILLMRGVLDTTLCDKVWQWLVADRWFSLGTADFSTNETDCHDITEILLKVALNTTTPFVFILS
jgi:hypothetical protein